MCVNCWITKFMLHKSVIKPCDAYVTSPYYFISQEAWAHEINHYLKVNEGTESKKSTWILQVIKIQLNSLFKKKFKLQIKDSENSQSE